METSSDFIWHWRNGRNDSDMKLLSIVQISSTAFRDRRGLLYKRSENSIILRSNCSVLIWTFCLFVKGSSIIEMWCIQCKRNISKRFTFGQLFITLFPETKIKYLTLFMSTKEKFITQTMLLDINKYDSLCSIYVKHTLLQEYSSSDYFVSRSCQENNYILLL